MHYSGNEAQVFLLQKYTKDLLEFQLFHCFVCNVLLVSHLQVYFTIFINITKTN